MNLPLPVRAGTIVGLALAIFGIALGSSAVFAQSSAPADPIVVAREISSAPIGARMPAVKSKLKSAVDTELRKGLRKVSNRLERDALKRRASEAKAAIDGAYENLDQPTTAMNAALIDGEFRRGAGDEMFLLQASDQERYRFFADGKLWKMLATVAPTFDFSSAALRMTTEYGVPAAMEHENNDPSRPVTRIVWRRDGKVLEFADQRRFYGCYTVIWADGKRFDERSGDRAQRTRRLNPMVEGALEDGSPENVDNIVDQILKK